MNGQRGQNETVIVNGQKVEFNYEIVKSLVRDKFYKNYSAADMNVIADNVMWHPADLDVSDWVAPYEENMVNAIAEFLKNHSVYDLDMLEDSNIILDHIDYSDDT